MLFESEPLRKRIVACVCDLAHDVFTGSNVSEKNAKWAKRVGHDSVGFANKIHRFVVLHPTVRTAGESVSDADLKGVVAELAPRFVGDE